MEIRSALHIKLPPSRSRCVVALFLALSVRSLPCSVAAEPDVAPPKTPAAEPAAPASATLMRTAYLALVKDSIVPAKPRVIATAALEVIATFAPDRALPLPSSFGADPETDAAWLSERVADLPPPWSVMEAMARSAETAHVGFGTPQRRQGISALSSGQPLSAPGFNLYPLADGRRVVFDLIAGGSARASGLREGEVLLRIDGRRTVAVDSCSRCPCANSRTRKSSGKRALAA